MVLKPSENNDWTYRDGYIKIILYRNKKNISMQYPKWAGTMTQTNKHDFDESYSYFIIINLLCKGNKNVSHNLKNS